MRVSTVAILSGLAAIMAVPAQAATEDEQLAQTASSGRVLSVGMARQLKKPSDAAKIAKDGDTIEIDAGEYSGDVALWTANNITIRGIGGRARLNSMGKTYNGKGVWVTNGTNITIDNIEFYGAKNSAHNGAGIRAQGGNLTVKNSYFHDNENGILGAENRQATWTIQNNVFANNGYGDGYTHAIYVGRIKRLNYVYNYAHDTKAGHHVKSRALDNYVAYNRLTDEGTTGTYNIDLCEVEKAWVVGNLLHQKSGSGNTTLVHFDTASSASDLNLVNNTAVNSASSGYLTTNHTSSPVKIANNFMVGTMKMMSGPGKDLGGNKVGTLSNLADPSSYNYHLKSGAPAINAGVASPAGSSAQYEYRHTAGATSRSNSGTIDSGAYEFH